MNYTRSDQAGYISCIKILSSEIEGILRAVYATDKTAGKHLGVQALIEDIIRRGKLASDNDSLFLPEYFLEYMKIFIFASFDNDNPDPSLSRHSSGHGVAKADRYTKTHALQLFLTLDQIYFYAS